jgi:hypothetical protein
MLFFQPDASSPFSPGKVFTFLFVMLGPLKVIGPFASEWKAFQLTIRAYVPRDAVKRGDWFPPAPAIVM